METTKEFNWIEELEACIKLEPSYEKYRKLSQKASSWPTCACGQLCKELPRYDDNCPKDRALRTLGIKFYDFIESGNWTEALETFHKIEKRTTELLCQMKQSS